MILGFDQSLPARPRRVIVVGTSGSGKTTLASRIAYILDVPHVEIDALFHGPEWTSRVSFEADVETFSSGPAWVTEWQYGSVRERLAERADLVVWLDLSHRAVMRQVIARTLRRRLRREVLWNGNIEQPLHRIFFERDHIVRWAWSTRHTAERRMTVLARQRPHLPLVRLRSRREVDRWTAGPMTDVVSSATRPPTP